MGEGAARERPDVVVLDGSDFARAAAERIADALRTAAAQRPSSVTVALSGGRTPGPVHGELARMEGVPWDRVEIFFGDERCVPPDDPESNYRMARETLLDAVALPQERVHRMEAERPDREAAAEEYAGLLLDALDLLLLGIGPDGHTASLFPGGDAVREERRKVLAVVGPKKPPRRMTVTPPVLRAARRVFVLARGREKAEAVARALRGETDPRSCPARLVRGRTWILDREAAGVTGGL